MAGTLNKVMIIGNLGADPEIRTTQGGQMVATLSIATTETFNNREGQRQEKTEWHRVVLWGKTAELAERYLRKGRKVYIEGRIQTRSWDDANGQKKYSTEIVANQMTFLDSGGGDDAGAGGSAPRPAAAARGGYGGGAQGGGGGGYSGGAQGGGGGGGYSGGAQGGAQSRGGAPSTPPPASPRPPAGGEPEYFDDDIPF